MVSISQFLSRGDFSQALALFDTIPAPDSESSELMVVKASVLASAGNYDDARRVLNGITAREPNNVDALLVLAELESATGRERDLRAVLARIIKIDPDNVEALITLGGLSMGSHSYKNAASYFDRVLQADSENREALLGRAQVYRYLKEPKNAEALLNKAITRYPQWAPVWSERARLYRSAGYHQHALTDYEKALALEPNNYWTAIDRGTLLVDLKRKADALIQFEQAKTIDPNNFLAYVYTAGIKDEFQDFDGAERDYTEVSRLKPEYYFAFEGVGVHKMRKKEWAAARDAFLDAYKQAPKEYEYALLAVMNWMRAGKATDPKQFLEQELRKVKRDSPEWYLFRLYSDLRGDTDVIALIDKEKSPDTKARMLYYLANFYDIRGNKILADKFFLEFRQMNRMMILEWRLNEWALEERGFMANGSS